MTTETDVAVDLGALAREGAVVEADQSSEIDKLAAALAKAQGAMRPAFKESENEAYKRGGRVSKYADLAAVVEAIRKPLAENELAVMQRVRTTAKAVFINTMLVHSSGQWVRDISAWPTKEPTAQAMGSAITYGKRYALSALLCVAADEDDDGNGADGKQPTPKPSGAEQVRGALAHPTTAIAKRAEPPKEAAKPHSMPPNADPAVAIRFSLLWDKAKKAGLKAPEFDEFRFRLLGQKKPSSTLTSDELDQLEAAWSAETAREPGSKG